MAAPKSDSDQDVVARCLGGEIEAYRELVGRYQPAVTAYLRGRLRRDADVDDATQETFVRAYAGLGKLKKPGSFFSWVMGIAQRVGREEQRRWWRAGWVHESRSRGTGVPPVLEPFERRAAYFSNPRAVTTTRPTAPAPQEPDPHR